MIHTLQISFHDQLAELVTTTSRRFARRFRTIAWTKPDAGPARSDVVVLMRARIARGELQVDAQAVASAIADRVYAGSHTLTLH